MVAINSVTRITTFIIMVLCFLIIQKHVVLVVLSPFLGKLAEATYRAVMNDKSTSPLTIPQSLSRGIRINLGNIVREVSFNLVFSLLQFCARDRASHGFDWIVY